MVSGEVFIKNFVIEIYYTNTLSTKTFLSLKNRKDTFYFNYVSF